MADFVLVIVMQLSAFEEADAIFSTLVFMIIYVLIIIIIIIIIIYAITNYMVQSSS